MIQIYTGKDAEALQKPIKTRHPASKIPGDKASSRHLSHLCPCILSFPLALWGAKEAAP